MKYPKKVVLGDITVRDGFQHEDKTIPTRAKLWCVEQSILTRHSFHYLGLPHRQGLTTDFMKLIR